MKKKSRKIYPPSKKKEKEKGKIFAVHTTKS